LGTGASLVAPDASALVYADMARWEIQMRWRRHEIGNFGLNNAQASPSELYKCGYFIEWRAADRTKKELLPTRSGWRFTFWRSAHSAWFLISIRVRGEATGWKRSATCAAICPTTRGAS